MNRRNRGGAMANVGTTAISKVAVMGVSGLLGILTSRLIISSFGTDAYAQYGLLASIPSLLPFADLGIAAVVINAVAGSAAVRTDVEVRRTIVTAFRILLAAGGILALVGVLISLAGLWPALLGQGLIPGSGPIAALLCLVVFGAVLPLTVGQRVLIGLNKTSTQVASQTVVAPFILLCVLTAVAIAAPVGSYLAVFTYIANALVSVICLIAAARHISPQIGLAVREVFKFRQVRGVKVLDLAWPMLLQMVALPIAMQSGRILLSHLTTDESLAEFNLASQLFGLVLQTIAAAGVALWPIYAKARSANRIESPVKPTLWFLGGGLLLGGALALLSPWITDFVSDGKIHLDGWLLGGFVAFVALQAIKYPVGMYMTDKRGLTFQVVPIFIMVPLNLGLSFLFIPMIGAGGSVIASTISVAACQVIPNFVFVQRDLKRRRAAAEQATDSELVHV